jgi:hypothetical protein
MTIQIDASGPGMIKFSTAGLSKNLATARNTFDIDWKRNSFEFHDIQGNIFSKDVNGVTKVSVTESPVNLSPQKFGPTTIQKILAKDITHEPIGNMPRLFCALPDSQGGFELLKDSDVRKHYMTSTPATSQDLDLSINDNSVSISTVSAYAGPSSSQIFVYRLVIYNDLVATFL